MFADPRLGFDPIEVHMERGAQEWRREVLSCEWREIGALGVNEARAAFDDRHFPRAEPEAQRAARDVFFAAD